MELNAKTEKERTMNLKHAASQAFRPVLIAGTALALLVLGGKVIKAFNPQPDPPGIWGMFGITPPETARLNVVNLQLPNVPPGPCTVQLNFIDGQGNFLKQSVFTLKPAQSALLDITGVEAGGDFRTEIHPFVKLATGTPVGCSPVATLELFDTTSGKTSILAQPIFIPAQVAQ
jgi:hypothetical protein